ncbi:Zinc transporter 2-like protein [Drosera capensis]
MWETPSKRIFTTSPMHQTLLIFLLLSIITTVQGDGDDEDASKPNLRAKSLILTKIWCLIIVFFATFLGGVSPCFFKWNDSFLVLGTQFAGGVFLGTAMMHFLSDSNETFGDLTSKGYPFAFMLACAGYLITMLADVVILYVYGKRRAARRGAGDGIEGGLSRVKSDNDNTNQHSFSQAHESTGHFPTQLAAASSVGDTILLIIALCFHSVFEGIAIGVAETKADAWKALWTISLHKIFAAVAMAIALLRMIRDRPLLSCTIYAFLFAISSPIGVGIGIAVDATTEGATADWIYAISMGLACGVFVYVSINHLLSKGYVPERRVVVDAPFFKFLAVLIGVGVIAVVMIWDT